jgi:hypothetical protein
VPATNLQTNMVAMTNTRQDYSNIGLVASEVARATVFLTQSQASSFDLDGSALPTVSTSHQYDGVRQCHPDRGLGN